MCSSHGIPGPLLLLLGPPEECGAKFANSDGFLDPLSLLMNIGPLDSRFRATIVGSLEGPTTESYRLSLCELIMMWGGAAPNNPGPSCDLLLLSRRSTTDRTGGLDKLPKFDGTGGTNGGNRPG